MLKIKVKNKMKAKVARTFTQFPKRKKVSPIQIIKKSFNFKELSSAEAAS